MPQFEMTLKQYMEKVRNASGAELRKLLEGYRVCDAGVFRAPVDPPLIGVEAVQAE